MAWSQEQLRNAAIIAQVGRSLGASPRDVKIAISAAIVESGLRNLNYGHLDSIGMFQQRDAWGSRADRLNPYKSARMFFLGGAAGQRGLLDFTNRGAMAPGAAAQAVQVSAFPDRYGQQWNAASALYGQVKGRGQNSSGFGGGVGLGGNSTGSPGLGSGIGLGGNAGPGLGSGIGLGGQVGTPGPVSSFGDSGQPQSVAEWLVEKPTDTATTPLTETVDALGAINTPGDALGEMTFDSSERTAQNSSYVQQIEAEQLARAAGDPMQSSMMPGLEDYGINVGEQASGWRGQIVAAARKMLGVPYKWGGSSPSGVDCSGLIALIYNQRGFNLPRVSADQARAGKRVGFDQLRPGDLVAIDNSSRNNGADHIGIYVGNGQVIHAPRPGSSVEVTGLGSFGGGWGIRMGG